MLVLEGKRHFGWCFDAEAEVGSNVEGEVKAESEIEVTTEVAAEEVPYP